jgi:transcriptional regulator GlxA family with amidase domain
LHDVDGPHALQSGIPGTAVGPVEDVLAVAGRRANRQPFGPQPADDAAAGLAGQMVLDRLLDLMLVSALRSWFDNPDTEAPAWCRALDDPVVGAALRLLHDTPAHSWTVADLATKVGVSRAALARWFTALVGEPPMAYLMSWRIDLAADLLRKTDHTVGTIARKVGYANAFALSVAFKRLRGTRPSDHRSPRPAQWRAEGEKNTT